MKKLKNWHFKQLIKAYRRENQYAGSSPLDMPRKAILQSFLISLVICLVIGNIFIITLHSLISTDLDAVEKNLISSIKGINDLSDKEKISRAVINKILPTWKRDLDSGEKDLDTLKKNIVNSFSDKESNNVRVGITSQRLLNFLKTENSTTKTTEDDVKSINSLRADIIGELKRSYWTLNLIPYFEPTPADELADSQHYSLFDGYEKDGEPKSLTSWKRYIFMSSVQTIRDELNDGLFMWRRLLLALAGGIQWVTFFVAVWCLVILLWYRIPWSKIQADLIENGKLEGLPATNIWDYRNSDFAAIDKNEYAGMFIAPRIIKDVINLKSDESNSIFDKIRTRVNAYRDSVEIGEYELINFMIWAAPSLGFIGTILGIISAMERASSIFSANGPVEQGIALDAVSTSLGTAFDTTYIALIWLFPMFYYLSRCRKKEADLFEDLEKRAIAELPDSISKEA
jgi:biopolymer transport protein ExbB/TolQ